MDLLKAFGELKSFSLVKDSATGISKGFAFCEFLLPEITDIACEGLHGLEVGDKKLIVQRASVGASKLPMIDGALPGAGLGRAILPIEILGANDLEEDEDYDFILDDIRKECELFGTVVEVHVPRPNDDKEIYVAGVGKVLLY
jgi:splicing factor U2AF subunit